MEEKEYLIEYVQRLESAFHKIMKKLRTELSMPEEGLTPPQFFVLNLLKEKQRTVTEIAELLQVQPSAITSILDRIHKSGFILRERDDNDRRFVLVQITEKGEEVYNKCHEKRLHILMHYFGYFEKEDLEHMLNIYEKMARIVENDG